MRKIEFEVPTEVFGDFTEKLAETGLKRKYCLMDVLKVAVVPPGVIVP